MTARPDTTPRMPRASKGRRRRNMKPTRTFARLFSVALASTSLAVGASACGGAATPSGQGVTARMPPDAYATVAHGERGERGGRVDRSEDRDAPGALLEAAEGLPLGDAQRSSLHALAQRLQANEDATNAAFESLRRHMAAQVRAGAVDPAVLRPEESFAAWALEANLATEDATLNALHAALDPAQRKAAVALARAPRLGLTEAQPGTESARRTERTERAVP